MNKERQDQLAPPDRRIMAARLVNEFAPAPPFPDTLIARPERIRDEADALIARFGADDPRSKLLIRWARE